MAGQFRHKKRQLEPRSTAAKSCLGGALGVKVKGLDRTLGCGKSHWNPLTAGTTKQYRRAL